MSNRVLVTGVVGIVSLALIAVLAWLGLKANAPAPTAPSPTPTATAPSSTPTAATPSSPAEAATASIEITNFAFQPSTLTVKVGTTVTWTNHDSTRHNVVSQDEGGPKSELLGQGQTYSHTFSKAGTFSYICQPHPYMKGTVVVTE